jgi:hypothetical protein
MGGAVVLEEVVGPGPDVGAGWDRNRGSSWGVAPRRVVVVLPTGADRLDDGLCVWPIVRLDDGGCSSRRRC